MRALIFYASVCAYRTPPPSPWEYLRLRYAYDSLIMHVAWAEPAGSSAGGAGGVAGGFRSGYGKALAQDTHLAVTYASNRTR